MKHTQFCLSPAPLLLLLLFALLLETGNKFCMRGLERSREVKSRDGVSKWKGRLLLLLLLLLPFLALQTDRRRKSRGFLSYILYT